MRPTSVLFGRDHEALSLLISIHATPDPFIVDCTANKGVMWKGAAVSPSRMFDINPVRDDCEQADCQDLPLADGSVDVLVFDPPHLPAAAASANSSGIERSQYGLTGEHDWMLGDNITPLFATFTKEARRVLRPRTGIVLAKLSDYVHNHAYQWSHIDFIVAARAAGLTPCDLLIKCDPAASNLKSSKWVNVRHLRRGHCWWIVLRSGRCERPTPRDHSQEGRPGTAGEGNEQ